MAGFLLSAPFYFCSQPSEQHPAWVCKLKIPALTYRGQGFMKVFSRCILQLELISDGKLYQTAVILVVAGTILVDC